MASAPTVKPQLSANALVVLRERYLRRDEHQNIVETPEELFRRVARAVAAADRWFDPLADVEATAAAFYEAMASLEFLPNTPALMNAGTPLGQLEACFVLPIDDSLDSIFETLKQAALIQKTGGGTGFSFSRLRPRGDIVHSTMGRASGPVSFMSIYDTASEVIKQGSKRRGANMGVLRVDHPDIREFITCKRDPTKFTNFNISVGVSDAFIEAVENGKEYPLVNPRDGHVWARPPAREIFDLIVQSAWDNGEPGLLALDTINRANPTPLLGPMEATNPCAEMPLLPYEACCLGSIDVGKLVTRKGEGYEVAWNRLADRVRLGVHFLDNVVEANRYPLPENARICLGNRKIGLGVMGFADLLIRLGIPYDSDEGVAMGERLMAFVEAEARVASAQLAEKRGVFPNFPGSAYDRPNGPRLRNATVTTIAPTGTISIIADCSSGIEPLFALAYLKRVFGEVQLAQEVHPAFVEVARRRRFYSDELLRRVAERGSIQGMAEIPADVRRVFVTALDIAPEWHVRMQAAFQRHVDNGVSKTINLPVTASPDDVRDAYILAYRLGCKGITVYRYGSRPAQVLSVQGYCISCSGEDSAPLGRPEGEPLPAVCA